MIMMIMTTPLKRHHCELSPATTAACRSTLALTYLALQHSGQSPKKPGGMKLCYRGTLVAPRLPNIGRKWVVEVSSAEWDADEHRWKYRI
jgi:hypothetical protein